MKIAIPVDETQKEVCVSFGRAPYFLIVENDRRTFVENPGAEAQGGAGLQAAQCAVDQEADVLITVRCGENAAEVLQAAEIEIYQAQGVDVEENLRAMAQGTLEKLTHFHPGFQGIQ